MRTGFSLIIHHSSFIILACCLGCTVEPARRHLLVYCGAGLRPPIAELAETFGREHRVTVDVDYAGSEMLLSRIKAARQGDLFIPGDEYYVEQAKSEGLVASSRTACYFVPVILVQKGNPKDIHLLAHLARPGLRLGLGDPEVCAVGRVTAAILAKEKALQAKIERNVEFRSVTVSELANHVKLQSLDAAIVWDAVAAYVADSTDAIPIPRDHPADGARNFVSTVAVSILSCSERPELADQFIQFATSPAGREVFRRHHYTVEPPK
jgi:molybdate transport system substrate-binding protein